MYLQWIVLPGGARAICIAWSGICFLGWNVALLADPAQDLMAEAARIYGVDALQVIQESIYSTVARHVSDVSPTKKKKKKKEQNT